MALDCWSSKDTGPRSRMSRQSRDVHPFAPAVSEWFQRQCPKVPPNPRCRVTPEKQHQAFETKTLPKASEDFLHMQLLLQADYGKMASNRPSCHFNSLADIIEATPAM